MTGRIKQAEGPLGSGVRDNVRLQPIEEPWLVHMREADLLAAEPVISHPHQVAIGLAVQKYKQQQRSCAKQKQEEQQRKST